MTGVLKQSTLRAVLLLLNGKMPAACQKQISDTRKVQLFQATAAAARDSGYYVELIYATAREVRAQLLLQVRQKAIATSAKERARAAGV
eukprot:6031263-Pleurochrysis_carterae.AAC.1